MNRQLLKLPLLHPGRWGFLQDFIKVISSLGPGYSCRSVGSVFRGCDILTPSAVISAMFLGHHYLRLRKI